jgi:polyhydroxyalkanoate synthesis repressor PhaR
LNRWLLAARFRAAALVNALRYDQQYDALRYDCQAVFQYNLKLTNSLKIGNMADHPDKRMVSVGRPTRGEKGMHKIKKYANRKMYDTHDKRYVTMAQLSELIKQGEEVMVIDNRTGEDITAAIISQLIGRDNKEKDKTVSSQLLMQLLRKGGDTLTDYAKKYMSLWQGAFNMAEDEVTPLVNRLVKNKELSISEAVKLKKEIMGYTSSLKSWISDSIDKRVGEVLQSMNLATNHHLNELSVKVDALSKKVRQLEKAQAPAKKKPPKKKAAARKKAT